MACVATLVVFTIARGHYYMLLLPANVFVPLWLARSGKKRFSLVSAIVPLLLVLSHYAALDYAGRIGVLGLGTAVWYFATCGMMLLAPLATQAAAAASSNQGLREPSGHSLAA
jgi:hypothetical protein